MWDSREVAMGEAGVALVVGDVVDIGSTCVVSSSVQLTAEVLSAAWQVLVTFV